MEEAGKKVAGVHMELIRLGHALAQVGLQGCKIVAVAAFHNPAADAVAVGIAVVDHASPAVAGIHSQIGLDGRDVVAVVAFDDPTPAAVASSVLSVAPDVA